MIEKKKRIDKEINVAKVTNALLHNPLGNQREIAEEAGVSLGTANTIIGEVEQNGTMALKSEKIEGIATRDINIIELGLIEIERRLKNKEELEKMRTVEISQTIRENTARYTLFKGNVTDIYGGMKSAKDIEILDDEELSKLIEQ